MATFNKINDWVDYMGEGVNLATDTFSIALSNTAPGSETPVPTTDGNGVLANVTEITYTNLSSRALTTTSYTQTSGTAELIIADKTLTSTGGSTGPFRYVYVYDDTVAGDPLVCYYDYGSSITLADGEELNIDFDGTNGLFSIT